jgi:hypothetical protein
LKLVAIGKEHRNSNTVFPSSATQDAGGNDGKPDFGRQNTLFGNVQGRLFGAHTGFEQQGVAHADLAIAAHRHTSAKADGAPSEFDENRLWIAALENKRAFFIDL